METRFGQVTVTYSVRGVPTYRVEGRSTMGCTNNILIAGIEPDPTLDWDQLKIRTPFPVSAPANPVVTESLGEPIPAPNRFDRRYQIRFSLLDRLIASKERNQALRS